jgi:regulator of protease activity HflC (stomatin/prohibitin superfamily)
MTTDELTLEEVYAAIRGEADPKVTKTIAAAKRDDERRRARALALAPKLADVAFGLALADPDLAFEVLIEASKEIGRREVS